MRLTKRSNKTVHENGVCCTHYLSKECEERSGYCTDECPWEEAVWSKLADYEDAEEQGLLLRLPCKVGDTVYVINKRNNLITEEKVRDVQYRGESYQKGKRFFMNIGASIFFEDEFGKLVFFDREEAEAALAEKGGV